MSQALTPKQSAILDFIHGYVEENGVPPSLREIGRHFDLSVGTVQDQVEALRRKGMLDRQPVQALGIRLPSAAGQVPILGRVFAGTLHAAMEDVEGHLAIDNKQHRNVAELFALRVRGDSMEGAGIFDGDHVIVRRQAVAHENDIVVARVEDDTTVKRLKTVHGRPLLCPENSRYRPIEGPFEIIGVVIELRRRFQ
jgi:repressor LexA